MVVTAGRRTPLTWTGRDGAEECSRRPQQLWSPLGTHMRTWGVERNAQLKSPQPVRLKLESICFDTRPLVGAYL